MSMRRKVSTIFHGGGGGKDEIKEQLTSLHNAKFTLERQLKEAQEQLENLQIISVGQIAENETLQTENSNLKSQVRELSLRASSRDEIDSLSREVASLKDQLSISRAETAATGREVTNARDQLRRCRQELQTSQKFYDILNLANDEMRQQVNEREAQVTQLEIEKRELQCRLSSVEEYHRWSQKGPQVTFKQFEEGKNAQITADKLKKELDGQKDAFITLQNEAQKLQRENSGLHTLNTTLAEREALMEKKINDLMRLADELETLRAHNISLSKKHEQVEDEANLLRSIQPSTLRSILFTRVLEATFAFPAIATELEDCADGWHPTGLVPDMLDKVLSSSEIKQAVDNLPRGPKFNFFYRSIELRSCSVCSRPKIRFNASPAQLSLKWLDEFTSRSNYFPCCFDQVCSECAANTLIKALESGWWHNLSATQWIKCPRSGCGRALTVRYEGDLELYLVHLGITDPQHYIKIFEKSQIFRKTLGQLQPPPSPDVLQTAANLHNHLVQKNRMYSLFDVRFDPGYFDDHGCVPEFSPGTIIFDKVDQGSLSIPFFTKFLRRQRYPKQCLVCSQLKYEINYGTVEEWKAECEPFVGPWMWNILAFPTSEVLKHCDHEFEICRQCTASHIVSKLNAADINKISCPQCNRTLEYDEIRQSIAKDDFERYEQIVIRKALAQERNFRWCLNPNCENGQLYEEIALDSRISCDECAFEMCFVHQVPWHENLTCEQYNSQQEHGDPDHANTQRWIRENSKECPQCHINIQKNEGCFHMTCESCQHEFCWECLADWDVIENQGQSAHKNGCWFQTSNVRPTGIQGNNLREALRRRIGRVHGDV